MRKTPGLTAGMLRPAPWEQGGHREGWEKGFVVGLLFKMSSKGRPGWMVGVRKPGMHWDRWDPKPCSSRTFAAPGLGEQGWQGQPLSPTELPARGAEGASKPQMSSHIYLATCS